MNCWQALIEDQGRELVHLWEQVFFQIEKTVILEQEVDDYMNRLKMHVIPKKEQKEQQEQQEEGPLLQESIKFERKKSYFFFPFLFFLYS